MHLQLLSPPPRADLAPLGYDPLAQAQPADPLGVEATTPILTPNGTTQANKLEVGDHVNTRNGGTARILSIDHFNLSAANLRQRPETAPIRFDPSALPGMSDDTALLISAELPIQIPVLTTGAGGATDARLFSQFPAKAFCDGGPIRVVIPEDGVRYINLHLEGAHEICAAGLWIDVESTCPVKLATKVPPQLRSSDRCEFRSVW